MSTPTPVAILRAVREKLIELTNLDAERVKIGPLPIFETRHLGQPQAALVLAADRGSLGDDNQIERVMTFELWVIVRIDQVAADGETNKTQSEQLLDAYWAIHAHLESLVLNDAGGAALTLWESGPVTPEGVDDGDAVVAMVGTWEAKYHRPLGAVASS